MGLHQSKHGGHHKSSDVGGLAQTKSSTHIAEQAQALQSMVSKAKQRDMMAQVSSANAVIG